LLAWLYLAGDAFVMTDLLETRLSRRSVLQAAVGAVGPATAAGALGVLPALRSAVYAAGSDKPEKEEVKIGFIPLTDCASVVMASVLGIDKKYGVRIVPSKEASWAGVRALADDGAGEAQEASRDYVLTMDAGDGLAGPRRTWPC